MNFQQSIFVLLLMVGDGGRPASAASFHQPVVDQQPQTPVKKEVVTEDEKEATKVALKSAGRMTKPEVVAETEKKNDLADEIVRTAMKYLGRPYSFGSPGPRAFDCSGFTSYVYRLNNMRLTHSSRKQYSEGQRVERKDLRKGDLVFFGNTRRGQHGISHVGIVTEVGENGNFKFVHASTSGGIKVDNSSASYYSRRYVGACRILADVQVEEEH